MNIERPALAGLQSQKTNANGLGVMSSKNRANVNIGWDDITGIYRSLTSTLTNHRFVRLA
ncbi:uncharacterized protein METZ01_LOCUS425295 [marine metagenome]|uniref:Uncharacterized protein n=1 Tax=marine metagenome TaxID=408172 RepID=A0A382XPU0_9ZZZZ